MCFYLSEVLQVYIVPTILKNHPIRLSFVLFQLGRNWELNIILKPDDNLIMVLSQRWDLSSKMERSQNLKAHISWKSTASFWSTQPTQKLADFDSLEMIHGSHLGPMEAAELLLARLIF